MTAARAYSILYISRSLGTRATRQDPVGWRAGPNCTSTSIRRSRVRDPPRCAVEYFGNFLLLSRVSSSALIVHSVVCMSVILYGRDSFCTVVRGRNLVVRRADDAALVRELPYRISVQYSYSVSDYGTSTVRVQLQIML